MNQATLSKKTQNDIGGTLTSLTLDLSKERKKGREEEIKKKS